jgi:glycosyltransferase involved in cell wall biosynthesis
MNRAQLKVLMISSDRNILVSGSAVSNRMKEYGAMLDSLHIILLCDFKHSLKENSLSENVRVYPTNSKNKLLRAADAIRIGNKIDCSIIVTQDPFESGWVGSRLKQKKDVPLEVQLHTDPYSNQFSGPLNIVRKVIFKRVLKHADGVRVVGEYLKSKIDHSNVYVLPIYVDRSRISSEPKFDLHERFGYKNVVLAVSRISAEKDIGKAIKAVSDIPDTVLVVVGDGPERSKFEGSEKVKFVGWQEDLASYYKTADVFIQTSKFEGYGLSLVEAGLSGLPVVTTPVGIARELKNVLIAETSSEFHLAIESALKNRSSGLREELETKILTKEEYLRKLISHWNGLLKP